MEPIRTFTIWYGDPENPQTWRNISESVQPIKGRDGEFIAENYLYGRPDGKFFNQTLVTDYHQDKKGNLHPYPKNILFEADHGRDNVGDIVVVLRKSPKGRWHVDVSYESVFITETESIEGMCLTRSSKSNVEQALHDDPNITILHKWSNPARLGGKPISCHFVKGNYSAQLVKAKKSVDVYKYRQDHKDLLGAGAFFEALTSMPYAELAFEVLAQLRDPNRRSI
jgi:hypothetical protein